MNRMRKTASLLLGTGLMVGALAACGSDSDGDDGDLARFRSVIFPGETYALDHIANAKGFFEENGIDISYLEPQSGSSAIQMLAAGEVDGWATAPSIIYNAASQGQPVKVGGLIPSFAAYTVVAPADADWRMDDASWDDKVSSLEGLTIGVSGLSAGTDLSLLAALDSVGLGEDDVERLGVGTTLSGLGQLTAGAIDAYVEFTGSGARIIEADGAGTRYVSLFGEDVPPEVDSLSDLALAINSDWAADNPDTFDAWLAALNQAREWVQDPANLDEAAQIIADASYNGDYVDLVKESLTDLAANMERAEPGFAAPTERVEAQIELLKRIGGLNADADITAADVILSP